METQTRLISVDDAESLAEVLTANREFLAPWQPRYDEEYFTAAGQRGSIAKFLRGHERGQIVPHVITVAGELIGRVTLAPILLGSLMSATISYWVAEAHNGCGHATAAVGQLCRHALEDLGLHRVEAPVLVHNFGSRIVLERNGFSRYGLAPEYLKIDGRWQDHLLYHLLGDD